MAIKKITIRDAATHEILEKDVPIGIDNVTYGEEVAATISTTDIENLFKKNSGQNEVN